MKKEENEKEVSPANHLAGVHTGAVINKDEQLGEVPEVLPTQLGGHPVINEEVVGEKAEEVVNSTEEMVAEKTEETEEVKKKDDSLSGGTSN